MRRITPGVDQESVWDYPRPPRLERTQARLRVVFGGQLLVDTVGGFRVLETSHPPTYYVPPDDVLPGVLQSPTGANTCEWKGRATALDVVLGERRASAAAWCYLSPTPAFAPIKGFVAFYAGLMDACYVDDERVVPQAGGFYGGWITSRVVGPFKGEPGSWGW